MNARLTPVVELFRELRQRKVLHVAVVYLGAVLVGLDAVNNAMDTFHLPDGVQRAFGVLVVLGFPVALFASWWLEWTEHGIRRVTTEPATAAVRRLATTSVTILFFLAVAVAAIIPPPPPPPPPPTGGTNSGSGETTHRVTGRSTTLGILPVDYAAQDDRNSWVCTALAEKLNGALNGVSAFTVVGWKVLQPYVSRDAPLDSVARELDLDYYISILIADAPHDRLTVLVDLQEGRDGTLVQHEEIPVARPPQLDLDSLVFRIGEVLRPALGRKIRLERRLAEAVDSVALRLRYQADQHAEDARDLVRVDRAAAQREFATADSLLALSGDRDDDWAEPHIARAQLADRWALLQLSTPGGREAAAAIYDRGIAQADEALRHDPGSADALAFRGHLLWRKAHLTWDGDAEGERQMLARAESDLKAALDRNARQATAAASLSDIYYDEHRFAEARQYGRQAYEADAYLDQTDEIINRIALSSFQLGDDSTAIAYCRRGLHRTPGLVMHTGAFLDIMAWSTIQPPDVDAAWRYYETEPLSSMPYYGYAMAAILARAGRADSARAVLARTLASLDPAERDRNLGNETAVLFRLGDIGDAQRLFRRYLDLWPDKARSEAAQRKLRGFVDLETDR